MQPIINQYGYLVNGVPQGGGIVGVDSLLTDQDNFGRNAGQFGYNTTFVTGGTRHNLHAGYQQYVDSEDLRRTSNGWGSINVPAGTIKSPGGIPIYYQATYPGAGHGAGADDSLGVPLAQHRGERHHHLEQLDDQRRPGRQQRLAVRPGPHGRSVGAVRLRQGDRDDRRSRGSTRSTRSRSAR